MVCKSQPFVIFVIEAVPRAVKTRLNGLISLKNSRLIDAPVADSILPMNGRSSHDGTEAGSTSGAFL